MRKLTFSVLTVIGVAVAVAIVVWGLKDRRPTLVCFGDSLTSCGGEGGHYSHWLARSLPYARVIDAGIGGDTLDGGLNRFERDVLAHNPALLVIALGANDFWRNMRGVDEMGNDLESMVRTARGRGIQVVIASCFGDRQFWEEVCVEFEPYRFGLAAEIAQMEAALCDKYECIYVPNMQIDIKPNRLPPFWDETDHPNRAGNEQVALRLLPAVLEVMRRWQSKS
ncbi:MAG: GDSL-type esterase/lipase family protein [Kiritimatiellae bacterium]|nr:GDSL-type esterase/lipase family protein [Kiritimatiellia bacterium]